MNSTCKRLVGYWHYGVILTYLSTISAIIGIVFSVRGLPGVGLICLFISGICDTFDGAVARTRKERTDDDKRFGMQIDSMSDLIAFGIAPIMIGVGMGLTQWYFIIMYCLYVLCTVIRLSYFNVTEEQLIEETKKRDEYEGMPIISIIYILAPIYVISTMFGPESVLPNEYVAPILMAIGYIVTAVLAILRFRFAKWHMKEISISALIAVVCMIALYLIRYYVCGVQVI